LIISLLGKRTAGLRSWQITIYQRVRPIGLKRYTHKSQIVVGQQALMLKSSIAKKYTNPNHTKFGTNLLRKATINDVMCITFIKSLIFEKAKLGCGQFLLLIAV
jgi:hypothetical protein